LKLGSATAFDTNRIEKEVTVGLKIGMVSTRFAGLDGVSLESAKWAEVLEAMGHRCYWLAGELDRPKNRSMLLPEAHFQAARNGWINDRVLGCRRRSSQATTVIHDLRAFLKTRVNHFLDRFKIDVLIVENALAIPMHIPLGLAITEIIAERALPAILHHHDFFWERARYAENAVADFLRTAFPPTLPSAEHVVINSMAQRQLAYRCGLSATLIPNVMDFERPPEFSPGYQRSVLETMGILPEDTIILQPTRVIQRKGIEHALDLVRALERPNCKLVVSHAAGDEGFAYANWLKRYAANHRVDLRLLEIPPSPQNGAPAGFAQQYQQLGALYDRCDFVTFPSRREGFGNALLEAIYFRKPVLVNRYETFARDIEPLGFDLVTMDGLLDERQIGEVEHILSCPERKAEMTRRNFEIARHHFSYRRVHSRLKAVLDKLGTTISAAPRITACRHNRTVIPIKPAPVAAVSRPQCDHRYAFDRR
jgi:glycosyltransferase involved in cell wall biosynthesis